MIQIEVTLPQLPNLLSALALLQQIDEKQDKILLLLKLLRDRQTHFDFKVGPVTNKPRKKP